MPRVAGAKCARATRPRFDATNARPRLPRCAHHATATFTSRGLKSLHLISECLSLPRRLPEALHPSRVRRHCRMSLSPPPPPPLFRRPPLWSLTTRHPHAQCARSSHHPSAATSARSHSAARVRTTFMRRQNSALTRCSRGRGRHLSRSPPRSPLERRTPPATTAVSVDPTRPRALVKQTRLHCRPRLDWDRRRPLFPPTHVHRATNASPSGGVVNACSTFALLARPLHTNRNRPNITLSRRSVSRGAPCRHRRVRRRNPRRIVRRRPVVVRRRPPFRGAAASVSAPPRRARPLCRRRCPHSTRSARSARWWPDPPAPTALRVAPCFVRRATLSSTHSKSTAITKCRRCLRRHRWRLLPSPQIPTWRSRLHWPILNRAMPLRHRPPLLPTRSARNVASCRPFTTVSTVSAPIAWRAHFPPINRPACSNTHWCFVPTRPISLFCIRHPRPLQFLSRPPPPWTRP